MSVDEFVAFSGTVLSSTSQPIPELCEKVKSVGDAFVREQAIAEGALASVPDGETVLKEMEKTSLKNAEADHYLTDSEMKSLLMPLVRSRLRMQFPLDETVIREFNEKKEKTESEKARREELENEIGVMQWDLSQLYEEVKEAKQQGDAEAVEELNRQVAELKKAMNEEGVANEEDRQLLQHYREYYDMVCKYWNYICNQRDLEVRKAQWMCCRWDGYP